MSCLFLFTDRASCMQFYFNQQCKPNHTTTKTMQQRKQNELLGIIVHSYFPITKHTNRLTESQRPNPLYTLASHKTTLHVVRYPPQFSTHHPTTKATSTQGKSTTHYNLAYMIIFYQPTNFYIIVNLILFIAEYPDYTYGHVNIILIQIIR